jgi:hypothetical protein
MERGIYNYPDPDFTALDPIKELDLMLPLGNSVDKMILFSTHNGTSSTSMLEKLYHESTVASPTYFFLPDPNEGESWKKPLIGNSTEAKHVKGKRLKKGTVVEKPFYLKQGYGKKF